MRQYFIEDCPRIPRYLITMLGVKGTKEVCAQHIARCVETTEVVIVSRI